MENIDYLGNANRQISKYNEAIHNIKGAIQKYEMAKEVLEKIEGVETCMKLHSFIELKIASLQLKIKEINNVIDFIQKKSRALDRKQREIQDLNNREFFS